MKDPPLVVLEQVDPTARSFPASWRDVAIVMLMDPDGGVRCPACDQVFHGRRQLRVLHMDHVLAYSRGGLTVWENLQLLCPPCNLRKGDSVGEVRGEPISGGAIAGD